MVFSSNSKRRLQQYIQAGVCPGQRVRDSWMARFVTFANWNGSVAKRMNSLATSHWHQQQRHETGITTIPRDGQLNIPKRMKLVANNSSCLHRTILVSIENGLYIVSESNPRIEWMALRQWHSLNVSWPFDSWMKKTFHVSTLLLCNYVMSWRTNERIKLFSFN